MMVLHPDPQDSQSRIDALVDNSNLVGLSDLNWEALGFDRTASIKLQAVRPKPEVVEKWRQFLSGGRKRSSTRANRIDGEAVAYLQALNSELSRIRVPSVRARLVTRAMTLINSVRHAARHSKQSVPLGNANFIRHPRLLSVLGTTGEIATVEITRHHERAERALIVALRTYQKQLGSIAESEPRKVKDAVKTLVQAWQNYESARLAIVLHAQGDPVNSVKNGTSNGDDLRRLFEWFSRDGAVVDVINDDLRKAIDRFRHATFALGRGADASYIQARMTVLDDPARARVLPMVAGAPGPVELLAPTLQSVQALQSNLEELVNRVEMRPAERYVAWALLFACQKRWELATIYCRSAIDLGAVLQGSGNLWSSDEARLLLAQLIRLGEQDQTKRTKDARARYQTCRALLDKIQRPRDARVLRELAAQILEARLNVDAGDSEVPSLDSGMQLLHSALDLTKGDDVLGSRILELGIVYYFAGIVFPGVWPTMNRSSAIVAHRWHESMRSILREQRKSRAPEEISRRAQAAEIIGFQLFQKPMTTEAAAADYSVFDQNWSTNPLLIPSELRVHVRDLRDKIRQSNDSAARLISEGLDVLVNRLERTRERDLIYAPIWASHNTDAIVNKKMDPHIKIKMKTAYEMLSQLTGASQQFGVHQDQQNELRDIARRFDELTTLLRKEANGTDTNTRTALFYCRMEACYSRLLLARMLPTAEGEERFIDLLDEY
jgi:hypothetical protein